MSTTECRLKHTGSETFYGVLSLLSFVTEIRQVCHTREDISRDIRRSNRNSIYYGFKLLQWVY